MVKTATGQNGDQFNQIIQLIAEAYYRPITFHVNRDEI